MSKIRKPSVSSKDNAEQLVGTRKEFQPEIASEERRGRGGWSDGRGFCRHDWHARAGARTVHLQYEPPEIPLPLGSLTYLDKKQYIHNMEIISHLPGATISGGEPLMAMWAKGKQRLLPAPAEILSTSVKPRIRSRCNKKRVIQRRRRGRLQHEAQEMDHDVYRGAAAHQRESPEYPHGQYDKELRDKVLAYKGLRGIRNYDITDPTKPNLLQEYNTGEKGNGTHHNFYDGGKYAYLDCGWDDTLRLENHQRPYSNALMIVDMSDPANVQEVSRWWVPGQKFGEEEEYKKYRFAGDHTSWTGNHGAITVPKRVEDGGTIGYGGFGAFGFYVMDLSDIKHPKPYGHMQYEFDTFGTIPFHTCYPVIADAAHPRLHEQSRRRARSARSGLPRELSHALHDGRERSEKSEDHRLLPAPRGASRRSVHGLLLRARTLWLAQHAMLARARHIQSRDHGDCLVQRRRPRFRYLQSHRSRKKLRGSCRLAMATSTTTIPGGAARRRMSSSSSIET